MDWAASIPCFFPLLSKGGGRCFEGDRYSLKRMRNGVNFFFWIIILRFDNFLQRCAPIKSNTCLRRNAKAVHAGI